MLSGSINFGSMPASNNMFYPRAFGKKVLGESTPQSLNQGQGLPPTRSPNTLCSPSLIDIAVPYNTTPTDKDYHNLMTQKGVPSVFKNRNEQRTYCRLYHNLPKLFREAVHQASPAADLKERINAVCELYKVQQAEENDIENGSIWQRRRPEIPARSSSISPVKHQRGRTQQKSPSVQRADSRLPTPNHATALKMSLSQDCDTDMADADMLHADKPATPFREQSHKRPFANITPSNEPADLTSKKMKAWTAPAMPCRLDTQAFGSARDEGEPYTPCRQRQSSFERANAYNGSRMAGLQHLMDHRYEILAKHALQSDEGSQDTEETVYMDCSDGREEELRETLEPHIGALDTILWAME